MFKGKILVRSILVGLGIPTIFFPGLILASVLGWNWQKDLMVLQGSGGYKQSAVIFPQKAKVTEVLDGDTIFLQSGQTVRLIGIDAPDRGEIGYDKAREYLNTMIAGETVELEYDYYQDDKFGRVLAYVYDEKKRMVNLILVKEGKAKVVTYNDRRKLKYEEILREAEQKP